MKFISNCFSIFNILNWNMNLETRKIGLINWITQISDEDIIDQIDRIRTDESNWFADVPDSVKDEIAIAEKQIVEGNFIPHSEQIKKLNKLLQNG